MSLPSIEQLGGARTPLVKRVVQSVLRTESGVNLFANVQSPAGLFDTTYACALVSPLDACVSCWASCDATHANCWPGTSETSGLMSAYVFARLYLSKSDMRASCASVTHAHTAKESNSHARDQPIGLAMFTCPWYRRRGAPSSADGPCLRRAVHFNNATTIRLHSACGESVAAG
jgi:hypothetical protein